MNLIEKIAGAVLCIAGVVVWYIDYLIFTAIGALTAWIATTAGITGMAVVGVQIIGWILCASIMVLLLFVGFCGIACGLGAIFE